MNPAQLESILASFKGKRVAVIGDIMLDKYIFGHVSRISPEYPVPVVDVTGEDHRLGGAANVALNTLSLGAETLLFGVTGKDADRELLLQLFRERGLETSGLIADPSRPTTCKTRILSQNHHITRVDFEKRDEIDETAARGIMAAFRASAESLDAVVLEDYNKGVLSARLIGSLIELARELGIPVLVDPKHRNFFEYRQSTIFKPNLSEMATSLGIAISNEDSEVEEAARLLQERMGAESLVVTRSEKGMTVLHEGCFTHIGATSLEVADVSGAGDTVIGTLALGAAAGLDIITNATLANLAAATVCQEVGAAPVRPERLLRSCRQDPR